MSREVVKEIILQTKKDPLFLQELLKNPRKTLASRNLSPKEKEFFDQADLPTLEGLSEKCFELAKE